MKAKFKIVLLTVVLITVWVTTFALAKFDSTATCTGSKSCSACKNCKYCKNCAKNGGTCGVCKK